MSRTAQELRRACADRPDRVEHSIPLPAGCWFVMWRLDLVRPGIAFWPRTVSKMTTLFVLADLWLVRGKLPVLQARKRPKTPIQGRKLLKASVNSTQNCPKRQNAWEFRIAGISQSELLGYHLITYIDGLLWRSNGSRWNCRNIMNFCLFLIRKIT